MSDDRFIANVREARTCGYDLVCSGCGAGMTDEEFEDPDAHDIGCPNRGRDRGAEWAAFLEKRLGER